MIARGTPDEKRRRRNRGPLKGIFRLENEYPANTPATEAINVDTSASTTEFQSECNNEPVKTAWKFFREKCGHSRAHEALESTAARSNHSIGAKKASPMPARTVLPVILRTVLRWVS